jgi:hypothetical protein
MRLTAQLQRAETVSIIRARQAGLAALMMGGLRLRFCGELERKATNAALPSGMELAYDGL